MSRGMSGFEEWNHRFVKATENRERNRSENTGGLRAWDSCWRLGSVCSWLIFMLGKELAVSDLLILSCCQMTAFDCIISMIYTFLNLTSGFAFKPERLPASDGVISIRQRQRMLFMKLWLSRVRISCGFGSRAAGSLPYPLSPTCQQGDGVGQTTWRMMCPC